MMNSELKANEMAELNEKELNQVAGGRWEWTGRVGRYDVVEGKSYYFVNNNDSQQFCFGVLTEVRMEGKLSLRPKTFYIVRTASFKTEKINVNDCTVYTLGTQR